MHRNIKERESYRFLSADRQRWGGGCKSRLQSVVEIVSERKRQFLGVQKFNHRKEQERCCLSQGFVQRQILLLGL